MATVPTHIASPEWNAPTTLAPDGPGPRYFKLTRWMVAGVAFVPMLLVYVVHFATAPDGSEFTGFLHYDLPSYMTYARQIFDSGFSLTYGLPYTHDADTPRVYFQPQTLLLGALWWATGGDPGIIFILCGICAGIIMFRLAISLLECAGVALRDWTSWLTCVAFLWGGGLLWFPGFVASVLSNESWTYAFFRKSIFAFDPFFGYWSLNLGRNVFSFPEAYYHSLFIGTVLLVIRKQYMWCLLVTALLSASHPFTGIELLLVLVGFSGAETLLRRPDRPPLWFLSGVVLLLVMHCGYYLVALDWLSADHRALHHQWSLPWTIDMIALTNGYGLVGVMALLTLKRAGLAYVWRDRSVRFFLVWFVVCLALVKHELLIPPRQPAHFTRGYVWMPLFLLAAPIVQHCFAQISECRNRIGIRLSAALIAFFLVSDNLFWFSRSIADALLGYPGASFSDGKPFYLTADARTAFNFLSAVGSRGDILVSNDANFEYLAILYTPLRAWHPHRFSTPHVEQRENEISLFLEKGIEPVYWQTHPVIVTIDRTADHGDAVALLLSCGYTLHADIGRYAVLRR